MDNKKTDKSSAVAEMGDYGHNRHRYGPKRSGLLCPFPGGGKWHLDPSSRLATIDMDRKLGDVPLLGTAGSPSNTKSPGPRPTSIPCGILVHPAILATIDTGRNWEGLHPLLGRAGSQFNTM